MNRRHPISQRLPDIYDLWKAATADECPVCNGAQARTDAEHATAAAKEGTQMSDATIIDEVEGHYPKYDPWSAEEFCCADFEGWPCLTQRLVQEVQRLRKELEEARLTIRAFVA